MAAAGLDTGSAIASNPVTWFAIAVSDNERARRFLESVLGLTLTNLLTMEGMQPGGGGGSGSASGGTLIHLSGEDCNVAQARVEPAGGKVRPSKIKIGDYGFIAICMDTEGNRIGLHSQR